MYCKYDYERSLSDGIKQMAELNKFGLGRTIKMKEIKEILLDYIGDTATTEQCWYEILQKLKDSNKSNDKFNCEDANLFYDGLMQTSRDVKNSENAEVFDAVSHPSHYTEGRKYEPRKVIHDWDLNFNLGNAVKYIARAGRKGPKVEDLLKAMQYITFELEELRDADKVGKTNSNE